MPPSCAHDETFLAHHECQGEDRRIHALVIGVGRYDEAARRFGTSLQSLLGASLAAFRFARYLINEFQFQDPHRRRLGTLRLMLSPLKQELDTVDALRYGPAKRKEVAVALQDWADDCNSDDQNLAVLYVAGHGVALGKGTSLLFLADAPTERSLTQAAINLTVTETRMGDCAAKDDLFVYDCCAVPPAVIPRNHDGAMAIDPFPEEGKKRVSLVCVNAARVGTETYAIGTDGTLLARGLLGDYRDRAGDDALLRIAGEIVTNRFGITPASLDLKLSPCLRRIAKSKGVAAEGYEATVTPGNGPAHAITLPDNPRPEFEVVLRGLRTGRTRPVAVKLLPAEGGSRLLAADAEDVLVARVPAGDYTLAVTSNRDEPLTHRLMVVGPVDEAVTP